MKTIIAIVAATLVLGALAGCGARDHIIKNYGRRNHVFFKKQLVHAEPAKGAPRGLDSEEAAAINKGYRKSMGVEPPREQPSQVLMVQPPKEY